MALASDGPARRKLGLVDTATEYGETCWQPTRTSHRPQRGIRSSGKSIKMVDHAQGWQGVQTLRSWLAGRREAVAAHHLSNCSEVRRGADGGG